MAKPWNYNKIGWKKINTKYKNISPPYIKLCPDCSSEMIYNDKYTFIYSIRDNKKCQTCANTGKNVGRKPKIYERTPEIRKKNRLAAIKRIKNQNGQIKPNFNSFACKIIDKYGKQNGYNFQHALNGGEFHIKQLGYWVDGYDKDKNVVIEYYEKSHRSKSERDNIRKQEIIDFLGCNFIEIKEWKQYENPS